MMEDLSERPFHISTGERSMPQVNLPHIRQPTHNPSLLYPPPPPPLSLFSHLVPTPTHQIQVLYHM